MQDIPMFDKLQAVYGKENTTLVNDLVKLDEFKYFVPYDLKSCELLDKHKFPGRILKLYIYFDGIKIKEWIIEDGLEIGILLSKLTNRCRIEGNILVFKQSKYEFFYNEITGLSLHDSNGIPILKMSAQDIDSLIPEGEVNTRNRLIVIKDILSDLRKRFDSIITEYKVEF